MQVSVKTLDGLERLLTVSVPATKVKAEVDSRFKKLVHTARLPGFRPGKAPLHLVASQYSSRVFEEVAQDLLQSTITEAFQKEEIMPAGLPKVDKKPITQESIDKKKDFEYTVAFEVFPEFELKELDNVPVEAICSKVTAKDVEEIMNKLADQHKTWKEVSRAAADGDKVRIDFEGFIDAQPFEGGKAQNYEIVIGSKTMIPGFEEGLIKGKKDKPFEIKVTFPDDYAHKKLASKEATFKITIHEVLEGTRAALDDELAKQFNITEGGIDALKKDIQENMERELETQVSRRNREKIFAKIRELNPFDVPKTLVDSEIESMKHAMFHRLYGPEHHENEQIPDFPRELFETQAKERVQLGLIFSDYVKKHQLSADNERVSAKIEKMASAYEQPDDLRKHFNKKENRNEIEGIVLEEIVAEKMASTAVITEKKMTYAEIMNPETETGA